MTTAQRQEIINNWLEGIDDPDYDVKPLAEEGKYKVMKRKTPLPQSSIENIEPNEESEPEPESPEPEPESPEPEISPKWTQSNLRTANEVSPVEIKKQVKPKPRIIERVIKQVDPKPPKQLKKLEETNAQILEHLKQIGDDMAKKRQKKEIQQEVQYQIQSTRQPDGSNETTIIIQSPRYVRRRIDPSSLF
jgi:hypothetical protein